MRRSLLLAPALALLVACSSTRPTEVVNVAFTVSIDTSHYQSWDFDLESCEDFGVAWIDDAQVRGHLLTAIEDVLSEQGYERVSGVAPDFLVSYELWVEPESSSDWSQSPARGSIVFRDGETGQFVWRATRKAPIHPTSPAGDPEDGVRTFAAEMLRYARKLHAASED